MNVQQNTPLKQLNTLAVESVADYFVEVTNIDDAQDSIRFAKQNSLEIKVLGGGSNVVLPDHVKALVLQYGGDGVNVLSENEEYVLVRVEAGVNWHDWVMMSLNHQWYGLENLAYIPGHVGAAPVQNIGAYGVEVKDFIQSVHGVYLESGEVFQLSAEECNFSYRESIFKQRLNNQVLITQVDFKLSKLANVNVSYAPLDVMASKRGQPTPLELANWVVSVRKEKLPDPAILANAGSFFKNPVVSNADFEALQSRFSSVPSYPQMQGVKVPAGWLIDQLGLKGCYFGPVSVHEKQALVLINHGGTGNDIFNAAEIIKKQVKQTYGIELEQEPRMF